MPFFTIVIPTFNSGQTLLSCLTSILNQTETDLEIVIQDGDSTDDTAEIVRSLNMPCIDFLSEPDAGIYDAMNKAINRSLGTWLLFLGSDDYLYDPHALRNVRKELIRTNAQLVYGDAKIVGDTPWAKDGTIYKGQIRPVELFTSNYSHQATFYHRQIFDNGHRYQTKYRVCADYDFNLFCTAKYRVQYMPIVVSAFVSGGMSSVETDAAFDKDKWENIIRYFGGKLKAPEFALFIKEFKQAGVTYFKRREFINALTAYTIYLTHKYIHRKR